MDITHTNIQSPGFYDHIRSVKTDGLNNLVAVDRETGDVTIYSSDQQIPSDIKQGIATNHILFEDSGADDALATPEEAGQFLGEVIKAGSKYDPTAHINQLHQNIRNFNVKLQDRMGQLNVRSMLEKQLDGLMRALETQDLDAVNKKSEHLLNSAKQMFFGQVYVPNHGFIRLNQPEPALAQGLAEIAHTARFIEKHLREDQ